MRAPRERFQNICPSRVNRRRDRTTSLHFRNLPGAERVCGSMKLSIIRAALPLTLSLAWFASEAKEFVADSPAPARVREIAGWLPAEPRGMGRPITDRAAWQAVAAAHPEAAKLIRQAEKTAAQPLPPWPEKLFLDYSSNGNRDRWQNAEYPRRERIKMFTLAECLENRGRFLPPLESAIAALCAEPTWVLSAHDGKLKNFHGEESDIDLGDSMVGLDLATADWLLGDRLSPATRQLIRTNLEHRVFAPYRQAAATGQLFWWMHGENNWNAVCLHGVTGAALTLIPSPAERAWYCALAEQNAEYYLGGFTSDGYCVEGLGYWNYGFGNYTFLAEALRQATGGHIDWLARPAVAAPALFGAQAEILNGIYPTIADSHPGGEPSDELMAFLNRRYAWGLSRWNDFKLNGTLADDATMAFLPADLPPVHAANGLSELPWRTCYPLGGVFTFRPGPGAVMPFAVCIKGGNNGVSHGHNDVGSFSVVAGNSMVICDPGGEVYTSRTFSAHRYDSGVLNSYGHAVPTLAGQLQQSGRTARAVLLATNYSATTDSLSFDLRSAYPVAGLKKMLRMFTYERGPHAALTVRDVAVFAQPETFESALITWGQTKQTAPDEWEFRDGDDAVSVQIDTGGEPFHVVRQVIHENVGKHALPVHVGFVLDHKVDHADVTLRLRPAK